MKADQNHLKSAKLRQLNFRVYEKRLSDIFQTFERNGFEPILIKGWAASQFYPKPWDRNTGDLDIVIKPEYETQAKKLLDTLKYLPVDLHLGLRHLDTVNLENLYENCRYSDCHGVPIRVLRPEDHFRVLCVHWLNDGGAYKEKLWDIYHAINSTRGEFEWDRCLSLISENRRGWIYCAIRLAHRYLGLDIKTLPINFEMPEIPGWVIKTVEMEWQSHVRLLPLRQCFNDRKLLMQQIWKRIPPNPIQACIELEEDFYQGVPRIFIQSRNIFTRLKPSVRHMLNGI